MKSQRRHELKENVLAHELGQMKRFFNRYGNWIWGVGLAVLIVVLIAWHYRSRSAAELVEQRSRFESLRNDVLDPDKQASALTGLIDLAENASDPVVSASACLYVANFHAGQHGIALIRSETDKSLEHRKKAEKYYRLVVDRHSQRKIFVAKARFGLGVLAENAGDWTSARSEFEHVRRIVGEGFPVAVDAGLRLKQLDVWRKQVRFSTTMPSITPTTMPTTAPATMPATVPSVSGTTSKPARIEVKK